MNYIDMAKNPRKFFRSVNKEDLNTTLRKVALPFALVAIIYSVLYFYGISDALVELYGSMGIDTPETTASLTFTIIIQLLSIPLSVLVMSGLIALGLRMLKIKSIFVRNARILIYTFFVTYIISVAIALVSFAFQNFLLKLVLFGITGLAISIFSLSLTIRGLSESYNIPIGKATGAYFIGIGLLTGVFLILMILIIIVALSVGLTMGGIA